LFKDTSIIDQLRKDISHPKSDIESHINVLYDTFAVRHNFSDSLIAYSKNTKKEVDSYYTNFINNPSSNNTSFNITNKEFFNTMVDNIQAIINTDQAISEERLQARSNYFNNKKDISLSVNFKYSDSRTKYYLSQGKVNQGSTTLPNISVTIFLDKHHPSLSSSEVRNRILSEAYTGLYSSITIDSVYLFDSTNSNTHINKTQEVLSNDTYKFLQSNIANNQIQPMDVDEDITTKSILQFTEADIKDYLTTDDDVLNFAKLHQRVSIKDNY
jgi:hypothetical protein